MSLGSLAEMLSAGRPLRRGEARELANSSTPGAIRIMLVLVTYIYRFVAISTFRFSSSPRSSTLKHEWKNNIKYQSRPSVRLVHWTSGTSHFFFDLRHWSLESCNFRVSIREGKNQFIIACIVISWPTPLCVRRTIRRRAWEITYLSAGTNDKARLTKYPEQINVVPTARDRG